MVCGKHKARNARIERAKKSDTQQHSGQAHFIARQDQRVELRGAPSPSSNDPVEPALVAWCLQLRRARQREVFPFLSRSAKSPLPLEVGQEDRCFGGGSLIQGLPAEAPMPRCRDRRFAKKRKHLRADRSVRSCREEGLIYAVEWHLSHSSAAVAVIFKAAQAHLQASRGGEAQLQGQSSSH